MAKKKKPARARKPARKPAKRKARKKHPMDREALLRITKAAAKRGLGKYKEA